MNRKIIITLLYVIPVIVCAYGTTRFLNYTFLSALNPSDSTVRLFEVAHGSSGKEIAKQLEKQGFIRHRWAVSYLSALKGSDRAIQAGEYELKPSMTPAEILQKLASGEMFVRRFTLKEGASMWEIGSLLQQAGIMKDKLTFEKFLTDQSLLHELQLNDHSLEGYLFPDTYSFSRGTSPKVIISKMYENFNKKWDPSWDQRLKELNMSKHDIVTLASIIEKESGNSEEQPLISSVFHNRLQRRMRLQSDPTVIAGIPHFNGNLTKEDLMTPTPYNTYVIDGLPVGPIGNPGTTSLEAAINPAKTDYLFFVANGQGSHVFSATLDEHNKAVNLYQRGLASTQPAK